MNNNDLYKFAWKVAKYFGTKPQFLYYDKDKDSAYFGKLNKNFIHYHLIFIAGIPLTVAVTLRRNKVHMLEDNVFWFKDKKEKTTTIISIDEDGTFVDMDTVNGLGLKYIKDIKISKTINRFKRR